MQGRRLLSSAALGCLGQKGPSRPADGSRVSPTLSSLSLGPVCFMDGSVVDSVLRREKKSLLLLVTSRLPTSTRALRATANLRHEGDGVLSLYLLAVKHLIMDPSRLRHLFLPASNSHCQISLFSSNVFPFSTRHF